jgi:2'-5' RNA ligase
LDIYQQLWIEATDAFERGHPLIDPNLSGRAKDLRRGVTLAFRPSPTVQAKVKSFLDRLATVAPGQHLYRPEELHVTVLAIISGTEFWRKEMRQLADGRAVINVVLQHCHPFRVRFRGVTASPGTVMIQGFPAGDALEKIRNELRTAFAQNGLEGQLDRRYKITAAHMTVMRFCRVDADWKRLVAWLEENRDTDFGEMAVNRIQLVWGDWCASADVVRTLQEFRLRETAG